MRSLLSASLLAWLAVLASACRTQPPAPAAPAAQPAEIDRVLERILAPPAITAASGFSATIVVPPGGMHDPLTLLPRDGMLWINDDGGVAGERGGFVWGVAANGTVSKIVDATRMMPSTGMDIAPPGFGKWGGRLLTLSTASVARPAVQQAHIIQHVDPRGAGLSETICTLPNHGKVRGGVPAGGIEARFGPPGPFENRYFSITIFNNTIYETTADGVCRPFATFDGGVWGLAFTPSGSKMLVTVRSGTTGTSPNPAAKGRIMSVGPDGAIDPRPVFEHSSPTLFDVEVAPSEFGRFAGQIFFTDWGANSSQGSERPPLGDGALYRVGQDGTAQVVASGFYNPTGIAFMKGSIWVGDLNRDGPFMGMRWLPDGLLVRIDVGTQAAAQAPAPARAGASRPRELEETLARMLKAPVIKAEPGFTAEVMVAPGQMYNPLTVIPRNGTLWVNDDGGEEGGKGGSIFEISATGSARRVVEMTRMLPTTGFDVAPTGFGAYGGHIVTLSQAEVSTPGVRKNHVIQHVDPAGKESAKTICTLPPNGSVNDGIAGAGIEARFGPPGSPFANRFFSVAILNKTIYQTTAGGECTAFATFKDMPWGLAFTPDGSRMLVSTRPGVLGGAPGAPGTAKPLGAILAVGPDGTIDPKPVLSGAYQPFDVEVAPADFGAYAGQTFFTEWSGEGTAGMDGTPKANGSLYRIASDGTAHRVATGFYNPSGIAFVNGAIWVADVNGDYMGGQKLPDGLIVRIRRQ